MECAEGTNNKINYIESIDEDIGLNQNGIENSNEKIDDGDYNENDEYRILDISKSAGQYQVLASHHEEDCSQAEDSDDEDRGVLTHSWQHEEPEQSDEENEIEVRFKTETSNLVKVINFLNKLQEEHQQFLNTEITDEMMIKIQKESVASNLDMLNEYMRDHTSHVVTEIAQEMKKILTAKIELFHRLYDKQVNGVVKSDVIKRLFSGNNMLIKTQIDELRRILFVKLEGINKEHTLHLKKVQCAKQARRKNAKHKVQVFKRLETKKFDSPILQISENLETTEKAIKSTLQNIQVERSVIQKQIDGLMNLKRRSINSPSSSESVLHYRKVMQPVDSSQVNQSFIVELQTPEREREENDESYVLEDFHSFTQVISKKLNLKPEEASPSAILSKFRTNLNRKLAQADQSSIPSDAEMPIIELEDNDYQEEEQFVEEVFFEDLNPEDIDARVIRALCESESNASNKEEDVVTNEHDSVPYIIQDITNNTPQADSYSINNITLTKLPTVDVDVNSPPVSFNEDLVNTRNHQRLHELNIEEVLVLKHRAKALMQLRAMEVPKDKTIQNKFLKNLNTPEKSIGPNDTHCREVMEAYLEDKLSRLEAEAKLARQNLLLLDKKKKRCRQISEETGGKFTANNLFLPYYLTKPVPKLDSSLDNKLKALFQNNNLKGNLMKRKLMNSESESSTWKMKKIEPESNTIGSDEIDNIQNECSTSPEINAESEVVQICDGNKGNGGKVRSNKKVMKVNKQIKVNEVTLPRIINGKREMKRSVMLPGESSKLALFQKSYQKQGTWMERGDTIKTLLPVRPKRSALSGEKNQKVDSNSKKLLDKLKQQIFDKLHKNDSGGTASDVRQEIERRLRRREKMKALQS